MKNQYGDAIRATEEEVLHDMQVENIRITIIARDALDCVVRVRVETALLRWNGE